MSKEKGNIKKLRLAAAAQGILTVTALARLVPCRRETIYFALENPTRFPRVAKRLKALTA